jgi:hypothetical protein
MARLGERVLLAWEEDDGLRLRVVERCDGSRKRWVEAAVRDEWWEWSSSGSADALLKARLSKEELEALKVRFEAPAPAGTEG